MHRAVRQRRHDQLVEKNGTACVVKLDDKRACMTTPETKGKCTSFFSNAMGRAILNDRIGRIDRRGKELICGNRTRKVSDAATPQNRERFSRAPFARHIRALHRALHVRHLEQ